MFVTELVRTYLKVRVDITEDELWALTQKVASELGFDINAIDNTYAELIAEEIDKTGGQLSTVETTSELVIPPKNKTKNKPVNINNNQGTDTLKTQVLNLRTALEAEVNELSNTFDDEFTLQELKAAEFIAKRAKRFTPNVIGLTAQKIQEYNKVESNIFQTEIRAIVKDSFTGFFDN